jgi:hypothetical protein
LVRIFAGKTAKHDSRHFVMPWPIEVRPKQLNWSSGHFAGQDFDARGADAIVLVLMEPS